MSMNSRGTIEPTSSLSAILTRNEDGNDAVLPFHKEGIPINGTRKSHRIPQSILRLPQNIP